MISPNVDQVEGFVARVVNIQHNVLNLRVGFGNSKIKKKALSALKDLIGDLDLDIEGNRYLPERKKKEHFLKTIGKITHKQDTGSVSKQEIDPQTDG